MQLVLWLAASYAAICIAGYFLHRHFMYFPNAERIAPAALGLDGVEEIELKTWEGLTLIAWHAPPRDTGDATVLYFHGNAGNAVSRTEKFETMRRNGHGVLLLNNRGYGGSQGSPSEAANVSDAKTAYDYLISSGVKSDEIVLYGESLGSGQAVRLAGARPVKAVILEAPLTSTVEIARSTYWFLPLNLILTDQFRNLDNIREVEAPLLLVHGKRDEIIPYQHSEQIHAAANEPKQIELMPNAYHSNLFEHGAWDVVLGFLKTLSAP